MDYSDLLSRANENKDVQKKTHVKRYDTTVSAAKKMERSGVQSGAIKAFLRKKEVEEQRRAVEADRKKQDLLSLRAAAKHNRRATSMAKRTKDNNFALSFDQPAQPKDGVAVPEKATSVDTSDTLPNRRRDEATLPPKHRPVELSSGGSKVSRAGERQRSRGPDVPRREIQQHERFQSVAKSNRFAARDKPAESPELALEKMHAKPKMPPPKPVNFFDLLKMAKEKQFEPVDVPVRKDTYNGRPMTQEEKDRTREEASRKLARGSANYVIPTKPKPAIAAAANDVDKNSKKGSAPSKQEKTADVAPKKLKPAAVANGHKSGADKIVPAAKPACTKPVSSIPARSLAPTKKNNNTKPDSNRKVIDTNRPSPKQVPVAAAAQKFPPRPAPAREPSSTSAKLQREKEINLKKRMRPDDEPVRAPPRRVENGPPKRNGPPNNRIDAMSNRNGGAPPRRMDGMSMSNRNIPPSRSNMAVPRGMASMRDIPRPRQMPRMPVRRRIESDSEEDEEMDDFIDDGPLGDGEDYSQHIRDIFGYDRRKFMYDREDDVDNMETSFVQQMKEEAYSARMGLKEDLDDIRMEEEALRRSKAPRKKRKS